jgi:hypothetical protein
MTDEKEDLVCVLGEGSAAVRRKIVALWMV